MSDTHRKTLGALGEQTAVRILEDEGLRIIGRNWRYGRAGELDIIAEDDDRFVVVEVRTRIGARHGTAFESIDPRKVAQLRRITGAWIVEACPAKRVRIDAISIEAPARVRDLIDEGVAPVDLREAGADVRWTKGIS